MWCRTFLKGFNRDTNNAVGLPKQRNSLIPVQPGFFFVVVSKAPLRFLIVHVVQHCVKNDYADHQILEINTS